MSTAPRSTPSDLIERMLHDTGRRTLNELRPWIVAADPERRVAERSAHLCAALSALATAAYRALGGRLASAKVERAAALLSLLTKIDDQVIDAPDFHAGHEGEALQRRVTEYLAPTLASIERGAPVESSPRCALAGRLGAELRALAGPGALGRCWRSSVKGGRFKRAQCGS